MMRLMTILEFLSTVDVTSAAHVISHLNDDIRLELVKHCEVGLAKLDGIPAPSATQVRWYNFFGFVRAQILDPEMGAALGDLGRMEVDVLD